MDEKFDPVIEEMRALAQYDRLNEEHEEFIDDGDLVVEGYRVARLADVPLAVQAYIKFLREQIWQLKHDK